MSTVIGNNPTTNEPIVISYGPGWPGPEAGQTIEYEREPDGSQGREIKRSGSSSGGSSSPPPQIAVDYETGESYEVSDPKQPVKVEFPKDQFEEYNKQVNVIRQAETDDFNRRFEASGKLTPYAVGSGSYDGLKYDIARALRDDPGNEKYLKDLGFKQDDIDAAKEANNAKMPTSQFVQQYADDRGWGNIADRKQRDGESNKDYDKRIKLIDKRMAEASDAYIAKYGKGDFALSGTANVASFILPVAKVIAPGVGWKDVTTGDIVLSAAQAALIATPFVAAKVVTGVRTLAAGKQVANLKAMVKAGNDETISFLSRTDPKLVKPFQNLSKAQGKYVDATLQVRDLQNTLKRVAPGAETRAGIEESLLKAQKAVHARQTELVKAGESYSKAILKTKGQKYDSPMVRESIERLPRELVRHTDNVVNDMLKPKSPIGNVAKLQSELTNARTQIPKLQKEIDSLLARQVTDSRIRTLTARLNSQRKIVDAYPEKIDKAIKKLDVEFGKGGQIIRDGKGGIAILDKPPVRGSSLSAELAKAGAKGGRKTLIVGAGAGVTAAALRAVTPEQAAREEDSRGVQPERVNAVSNRPITRPESITRPGETTQPGKGVQPGSFPESGTQPGTQPEADTTTQAKVEPQPKPGTKPQPVTASRTTTPTKTPVPPKTPGQPAKTPVLLPSGGDEDKKPLKLKPGSLAWQQGTLEVNPDKPGPEKVIKYAEPMKYQVVTIVDRTPKGYQDKGRTPKETIQTIGGPVKRRVTVDIGVTQAIADGNSITFISKPRQPKLRPPKLPKPTKLDTRPGRIVRVHKARRGGGYTRRSNR